LKAQPFDPMVCASLFSGERALRPEQYSHRPLGGCTEASSRVRPPNASYVEYSGLAQDTANAATDGKILDWLHNQLQAGRLQLTLFSADRKAMEHRVMGAPAERGKIATSTPKAG